MITAVVVVAALAVFGALDLSWRRAMARRHGVDPSDEFGRILAVILADRAIRKETADER